MQEFVTEDVTSILLPNKCVDVGSMTTVSGGGFGLVFRSPLACDIVTPRGEHVPKKTVVVRSRLGWFLGS